MSSKAPACIAMQSIAGRTGINSQWKVFSNFHSPSQRLSEPEAKHSSLTTKKLMCNTLLIFALGYFMNYSFTPRDAFAGGLLCY